MIKNHKKPLKICLLGYRSNPHCGGQGVYIKNLSRALKDLGHEVDVISGPPLPHIDKDINLFELKSLDLYNPEDLFRIPKLKEIINPINFCEWLGVITMGFPEPFTFGFRAYNFLKKNVNKYDIIHDNQCLAYGIGLINKFIPTIATIHHPITVDRQIDVKNEKSPLKKVKHMRWYSFIGMQKRVAKKFSHIITVSRCSSKDISKEFKIPLKKFRIVPNGIDINAFYPIPEIQRENNRIIVTNSADIPLKGLRYLLESVAEISKKRDVKLIVIGTPKKDGKILRLVKRLNINKHVTFTGRIDHAEFVRQYAKATVAVVPSLYEGFGLPAGEAMACGVPVISTNAGALPEVVGNAGILVPPGNSKALTSAILKVFDNPDFGKKIGDLGYQRIKTHFTWKVAAEKCVDIYREVIDAHRRFQ
ncbi:MAG: glycosyltransferase family 4 protein [Desulfobacterales bacterium]|nr:glycosyltransferase family 4 protein [Desulfobacterales bacterium]